MTHYSFPELLENRIAPAGLVALSFDEATGELRLMGDDASNAFDVFRVAPDVYRVEGRNDVATLTETSIGEPGNGGSTIGKVTRLIIESGGGDDKIELRNMATLTSLNVNTGSGNDSLRVFNLTLNGRATFDLESGNDRVRFSGLSTSIVGNLVINSTGSGDVNFGAARSSVSGSVRFNGGVGSDSLTTSPETELFIGKGITFQGGGTGTNRIAFGDQGMITIGKNALGQSIVFQGGSGTDTISIGANTVLLNGSVEMDGGAGADLIDFDGVKVKVGKNLQGVSVSLIGGSGADEIDIQSSIVKIAGLISLNGGTEADVIDLTNIHRLVGAGAIAMDGGTGADRFEIEADLIRLLGSVKMLGGDDADYASIEADGSIGGGVKFLMGGANGGAQNVEIRGRSGLENALIIRSGLTVDATGSAASTDVFRLTNVISEKATLLTFGDGVSDVDIDNLTTLGSLTIDTRNGNDDVRIERDAVYGVSRFAQAAAISLGEGNDLLRIGKNSKNNRLVVTVSLTADGGGGTDSRNDIQNANRFPGAARLIVSGFEVEDLA